MDRRKLLAAGAALSAGAIGAPIFAQQSPRQMRLVVGYPAGGVADFCARVAADALQGAGYPAIVENRPGAAGNIALDYVARQPRDSGVLGVFANSLVSTNPFVPALASRTADPNRDMIAVAGLAELILVLAVPTQHGIQTLDQFMAKARTPGTRMRIGLAGTGTPHHLSALLLERMAGLDLTLVPYKGGAPMIADAAGGHLDAVFTTVPVGGPLVAAGKLRWLAIVQPEPLRSLPAVPSLAPVLKHASMPSWIGVWAPASLPIDAATTLNAAFTSALGSPSVAAKLRDSGLEPIQLGRPQLESRIAAELGFMKEFLSTIKVDFQT